MLKRLSAASLGRWSIRRPWLAIVAWLGFVVVAVLAVSVSGSKQLHNGAVGESARGYALMDQHRLGFNPREYAYLHSDSLAVGSPAFHAAIEVVATHMRQALGGRVAILLSRDRHAALIAGDASAPFSVAALQRSVDAVRAAHP